MDTRRSPFAVVVLIVAVVITLTASPNTGFSGRVWDGTLDPVPDGTVAVYNQAGDLVTQVPVDGDGRFLVDNLDPGTYYAVWQPGPGSDRVGALYREAPDFATFNYVCFGRCGITNGDPIQVVAGAIKPAIDFIAMLGGTVAHLLVDDLLETPLQGAVVEAYDTAGNFVREAQTGADGVARFYGFFPGDYYVGVSRYDVPGLGEYVKTGYPDVFPWGNDVPVTTGTPVRVNAGVLTTQTQRMQKGSAAAVTFGDGTGTRIPAHLLVFTEAGTFFDYVFGFSPLATPALTPGTYRLGLDNASGYGNPPHVPVVVPQTPPPTINWDLIKRTQMSGKVTGPGGVPVESATVHIYDAQNQEVDRAYTNALGEYLSGRGLPAATYYWRVDPPGHAQVVYDGVPCPDGTCDVAGTGTGIVVDGSASILPNINAQAPACPTITVLPADSLYGASGQDWLRTIRATGGTPGYHFTVQGTLPAGLSLSHTPSDNEIVYLLGQIMAGPGYTSFTIVATDQQGCSGSRRYSFVISDGTDAGPSVTSLAPDSGPAGTQVTAVGQNLSTADVFVGDDLLPAEVLSRSEFECVFEIPVMPMGGDTSRRAWPRTVGPTVDITVVDDQGRAFTLEDAFTYVTGPLADLLVQRLVVPLGASPGQTIQVTDTTRNRGKGAAPESSTTYYLSTDPVLNRPGHGPADDALTTRAVGPLAPRATSAATLDVTIPPATAPGAYFLIAVADAAALVIEANEANNTRVRPLTLGPDLLVKTLTAPPAALPGATLTVKVGTRNGARGPAPASLTRLYWSADATWDPGDALLATQTLAPLAGRTTRLDPLAVTVPADATKGQVYYLLARADADAAVAELNEDNNGRSRPIRVK